MQKLSISLDKIQMESSWKEFLKEEFFKPYFLKIKQHFLNAKQNGEIIYPPAPLIFNAFNLTPLQTLKVVILGQDPYHNKFQAMGLSFSVPKNIPLPPSLKNIYKELYEDLKIPLSNNGDLSKWAKQGVLLLNSILSVQENKPASHQHFGWQLFTDNVITRISQEKSGIIFLLWGNYARAKKSLIDSQKHFILEAAHPSPLAKSGFLGCKHFSKTNKILQEQGKTPIDWQIH